MLFNFPFRCCSKAARYSSSFFRRSLLIIPNSFFSLLYLRLSHEIFCAFHGKISIWRPSRRWLLSNPFWCLTTFHGCHQISSLLPSNLLVRHRHVCCLTTLFKLSDTIRRRVFSNTFGSASAELNFKFPMRKAILFIGE